VAKTIELGKRGRDSVSGWEGVLTARYEYMNGCVRYELSSKDKDGKPQGYVFDEQQIEMVEAEPVPTQPRRTGGARGSSPVVR
jgi:hypothetical protein